MRRSRTKPNRRRLLTILALVSLIGFMLPESVTGPLISLVQVLVPFQDWTTRSADAFGELYRGSPEAPVSPETFYALRRENEALRHRLASLSSRYHDLDQEHRSLAGIRRRGLRGGRLIPARTVAADALPWRDSYLINAGTLSGVRHGAPATSHLFTVQLEQGDAAREGLSVLAGETLVGFIDQVGTHSARVRLLCDRETRMKVLIARFEEGAFHPLDKEFWMVGTGDPLLEIRDIDHRYIKSSAIQTGDYVLTSPTDVRLPAPMTVGTIAHVKPDQDNGLLYRLEVKTPLAPEDIRTVFVVDPHGEETP